MTSDLSYSPSTGRRFGRADWAWAAVLGLLAFALYARTAAFGFIYLDDQNYVASNVYVQHGLSGAGLRWALTTRFFGNYHPLTLLTELVLSSLFGPGPGTFHEANAVLHGAVVAVLFAFLRSATGRAGPAAAVAALWGFHPLRVESVAWIAELKDELSGLCWVGCLLAYAAYARRRTGGRYAAVAGLLVLALLSKPTTVTLPLVLLLNDVWPLGSGPRSGRWWRDRALEKVPLFALAGAAAISRVFTEVAPDNLTGFPTHVRVGNALLSTATYLRQWVWPTGLAVFYPHPWTVHRAIPAGPAVAAGLLLTAVTVAAAAGARRRPYLIVGWLWSLVTLLPTVGLLQSGDQARADRYTYLPTMGLTIAVVYAVADWASASVGRRRLAAAAGGGAAVALAAVTLALVPTWRSARTVWARADAVVPDNYFAESFLSELALHDDRLPDAERYARESIATVPGVSDGHLALGQALDAEHRPAEAAKEFDEGVRLAPDEPIGRYKAGLFLDHQGRGPAARAQFGQAIALDPAWTPPRLALAFSLAHDGRLAEAADAYRRVLAIDPGNGRAQGQLADVLRLGGDPAAAEPLYVAALAAGERDPDWEAELAWLTAADPAAEVGQLATRVGPATDACEQTGYRKPFPPYALSLLLARLGRFDDAVSTATTAQSLARRTGPKGMADAIGRSIDAFRQGKVSLGPVGRPSTVTATTKLDPSPAP